MMIQVVALLEQVLVKNISNYEQENILYENEELQSKKSSGEETEGGKKSNSKNKVNDKEQNDSLLNNVDQ